MAISPMFLNGISHYGVRLKSCFMVFERPTFDWTESVSYWEIERTSWLVWSVFTITASRSPSKNAADQSNWQPDFSAIDRLSSTKWWTFKDHKTSFEMNPITWNSVQEHRRYGHSNIGTHCELYLHRMQNWFRGWKSTVIQGNQQIWQEIVG